MTTELIQLSRFNSNCSCAPRNEHPVRNSWGTGSGLVQLSPYM
jgi:hypothetical protein